MSGLVQKHLWIFPALALLILGIGSFCQSGCEALQGRIFGIELELFGAVYYAALLLMLIFFRHSVFVMIAIAVGVGAEIIFIEFQIEHSTYCIKCLLSGLCLLTLFALTLRNSRKTLVAASIIAGFTVTLLFFDGSVTPVYGEEPNYPVYGNPKGKIEVVVYSDYFCVACIQSEGEISRALRAIRKKARIIFVDVPIHKESLAYAEIFAYIWLAHGNDLDKAIRARAILFASKDVGAANAALVSKGIAYTENKEQAKAIFINYYNVLLKKDNIKATPTVVIMKKGKRDAYVGLDEIKKGFKGI
jgi:uncharacterized membrane protein